MKHNFTNAFTLIELSIVLVIVGLVVGGVVAGRSLIKVATLQSVVTDISRFNTAVTAFREQYNCIPGDCVNITTRLGAISGGCASDHGSNSGTCDGNGNGRVDLEEGDNSNWFRYNETTLFWQQLSLANLIAEKYTGMLTWNGRGIAPGINTPVSRLDGGCFSVYYSRDIIYKNVIALGSPGAYNGSGVNTDNCSNGLYSLPAESALMIDKKIDDGKPYTGSVWSVLSVYGGEYNWSGSSTPGCTNENGSPQPISLAVYDISAPKTACQLVFVLPVN